jgi:hypothetical protein
MKVQLSIGEADVRGIPARDLNTVSNLTRELFAKYKLLEDKETEENGARRKLNLQEKKSLLPLDDRITIAEEEPAINFHFMLKAITFPAGVDDPESKLIEEDYAKINQAIESQTRISEDLKEKLNLSSQDSK